VKAERTQLLPRPAWENPRVHLLDDIWLMTLVAIVFATGIPWLLSGFEIDVRTASWGLLALGALHVAFTMLASANAPQSRWRGRVLTVLDVTGVVLIGFIWQHIGAVQNPVFLTVFVLPVIGSIFLSRWHPYLLALVSVAVAAAVSLSAAPELRWYVSGLFGSDTWLVRLFGDQTSGYSASFSGFYAPSSYLVVLLEVFAVAMLACAVAAEYLGTIFERLNGYILMARSEAERGQELWAALIERLPLPSLLVDPDTMRVVACSESAVRYLRAEDNPLEGRELTDVVRFSYPDIIEELIVGTDGEAPATVLRLGEQVRVTQLRVLHVAHKGRRLALLSIDDRTEAFCVKAALDTSEYAAVVLDARARVLALNKPAAGLFAGAQIGMEAARLLPDSGSGLPWWEPGLTGRRKLHVEIGPRVFQVTSSAVVLGGEEERIFTVSFLPVARAGTPDPFGTSSTMAMPSLAKR
jgi:PAS domain-containing protein